jgi:hypothetical protein
MKEVYKRVEIIQAYSPEALIAHHNWLLDGLRKFNNDKDSNGTIKISSLSPHYEHKYLIKETWKKSDWENYEYEENFSHCIKDGYFIVQRATYELSAFDEKCVFEDKSGEGYLYWFNEFLSNNIGYDDYPEDGADYVTPKSKSQLEQDWINSWKLKNFDKRSGHNIYDDGPEPTKSELEKYKKQVKEDKEKEKMELLESWK